VKVTEVDMLSLSTEERPAWERRSLVERVRDAVTLFERAASSPPHRKVWARSAGLHVLLGLRGKDAFARLTPLGGASYGLAFRGSGPEGQLEWEPLLLVDELDQVVEHALIAEGALPG
jgi:hypothetical protein